MRVLVLVLSCAREPWWALREAQRRTWDSVAVDEVETQYYYCDGLADMPGHLRRSLRFALTLPWVVMFRTNSSSYVDKHRLFVRAASLVRYRLYCGIDGGGFASGSGFFLSRDAAEILARDLPDRDDAQIEDHVVGQVLAHAGIAVTPGAERADFWVRTMAPSGRRITDGDIRSAYHVRCKNSTADRDNDILAMETVHRIKGHDI